MMTDELEPKCKKNLHRFGNVYLLVCHVQFLAQGAGFCLQFPNVQDKRALYKGAASRNFVLSEPHLERETAHDRRTNRHFLLGSIFLSNIHKTCVLRTHGLHFRRSNPLGKYNGFYF